MAIWDVVTRPVRGLGRLLRGKFREGLGDIGYGARTALPLALGATGVGAPLAIGLAAAGGALERGAGGGFNLRNVLAGGAGGAATGGLAYAGGRALPGLGEKLGMLRAGAPGAPVPAALPRPAVPPTAMPNPVITTAAMPAPPVPPAPTSVPIPGGARVAVPAVEAAAAEARRPALARTLGTLGRGVAGAAERLDELGGDIARGTAERFKRADLGDIGQLAGGLSMVGGTFQEAGERSEMRRLLQEQERRERERHEALAPVYASLIQSLLSETPRTGVSATPDFGPPVLRAERPAYRPGSATRRVPSYV